MAGVDIVRRKKQMIILRVIKIYVLNVANHIEGKNIMKGITYKVE